MRPILAFAVAFSLASSAIADDKPVKIPLKEIWALNMPGTKNIRELKGQQSDDSLVIQLERLLHSKQIKARRKGFAVPGTGLAALNRAYAGLFEKQTTHESLAAKNEVSLVFFSRPSSDYVHLQSVERQGDQITIKYVFVPHKTRELSAHFALIPMGKLPAGKWRVDVVKSPMAQKYLNAGFNPVDDNVARGIVCAPFTFEIVSPKAHTPDN